MQVFNEMTKNWMNQSDKRVITKTEKYYIYTEDKKYLDTQMGNSSFIYGYDDIEILDAIRNTDIRFLHSAKTSHKLNSVTEKLLSITNMKTVMWTHSGSDAVESAIALNDHYWNIVNEKKKKIITIEDNYHGCTFLTKAARGETVLDRFIIANKDNIEHCIDEEVGAILVETIPWIHTVAPRSKDWWFSIRKLCDDYNINLIVDDCAGCFGKLGYPISTQRYDVVPDIVAISKAMTAGYIPLGAALGNDKIVKQVTKSEMWHSHTYNPSAHGIEALNCMLNRIDDYEKIPLLEKRLFDIFSRTGLKFHNIGLLGELALPEVKTPQQYWEAGMELNIYNPGRFIIAMPMIADDEYFECLENSLTVLLSL